MYGENLDSVVFIGVVSLVAGAFFKPTGSRGNQRVFATFRVATNTYTQELQEVIIQT
jgi:hypothetical protein